MSPCAFARQVSFDLTAEQQQSPQEDRALEHAPSNQSPFRQERVGMYSKRGAKAGENGTPAVKINQDRGCACSRHHEGVNVAMFCVCDGHGPHGECVSEFVMTRMQQVLLQHEAVVATPEAAIAESLVRIDRELLMDESVQVMRPPPSRVAPFVAFAPPSFLTCSPLRSFLRPRALPVSQVRHHGCGGHPLQESAVDRQRRRLTHCPWLAGGPPCQQSG